MRGELVSKRTKLYFLHWKSKIDEMKIHWIKLMKENSAGENISGIENLGILEQKTTKFEQKVFTERKQKNSLLLNRQKKIRQFNGK